MSSEGVGGGGGMQGVSDEFTITATTNGIPATVCTVLRVHHSVCTKIHMQEEAGMFHGHAIPRLTALGLVHSGWRWTRSIEGGYTIATTSKLVSD